VQRRQNAVLSYLLCTAVIAKYNQYTTTW